MKSILHVFASKRMAIILFLGFSAGIPLGLTGGTLQAWMTAEKVDLTVIGIFSLVGLPYTFKFAWAPLLDRYVPPFLGRRRGWMIVMQALLVLGIAAMSFSDPLLAPGMIAALAVAVAFFSASQDIVIDAYRTEVLPTEEYGAGAGVYIMGYRLAMLVSGAVALILADHLPWKIVYLIMAATMGVGIIATLLAPEPAVVKQPRNMTEAVIVPFVDYFKRQGAIEILVFIILYKLDVAVALALMTTFFVSLGYSGLDIGGVTKGFGLVATIVGTLAGGAYLTKWGLKKSLWVFGVAQGVSTLLFLMMAHMANLYGGKLVHKIFVFAPTGTDWKPPLEYMPHAYTALVATIGIENLCSGMGTAAYSAFIMRLCNKQYTAFQYALLTSLMAATRVLAGAPTGYMAKAWGWEVYFIVATLLMIPGLLLLLRYDRWKFPEDLSAAKT